MPWKELRNMILLIIFYLPVNMGIAPYRGSHAYLTSFSGAVHGVFKINLIQCVQYVAETSSHTASAKASGASSGKL